jgi:hypothetical protein
MNESQFRQVLADIAREAIPDTVHLEEAVMSHFDKPKRKRQPRRAWQWAALAAVLALLISAAGLIARQRPAGSTIAYFNSDPGLTAILSRNLATELNLTQRHPAADVQVTLQWAYADGNRIALGYLGDYAASVILPAATTVQLFDETGQALPAPDFIQGGGGGGGGGGDRFLFSGEASFDARGITTTTGRLNLRLVITFSDQPISGGGGGGGGGSGGGDQPNRPQALAPFALEYTFSVPFIPAVRVTQSSVAAAAGVTMEMRRVDYAPSVTLAALCFTLPNATAWYPATASAGNPPQDRLEFIPEGGAGSDGRRCGQLVVYGPPPPAEDGTLHLQIDRLVTAFVVTDARLAQFQQAMEDAGFKLEVYRTPGGETPSGPNVFWYGEFGFRLAQIPPALLDGAYYNVINDITGAVFVDRLEGPWQFAVALPPGTP